MHRNTYHDAMIERIPRVFKVENKGYDLDRKARECLGEVLTVGPYIAFVQMGGNCVSEQRGEHFGDW